MRDSYKEREIRAKTTITTKNFRNQQSFAPFIQQCSTIGKQLMEDTRPTASKRQCNFPPLDLKQNWYHKSTDLMSEQRNRERRRRRELASLKAQKIESCGRIEIEDDLRIWNYLRAGSRRSPLGFLTVKEGMRERRRGADLISNEWELGEEREREKRDVCVGERERRERGGMLGFKKVQTAEEEKRGGGRSKGRLKTAER